MLLRFEIWAKVWDYNFLWQAALKVLAGDDDELLKIIPVLLGCKKKDAAEGDHLESNKVQHVVHLVKETAFSHLMEV